MPLSCLYFRPSETAQNGPQRPNHEKGRTRSIPAEESHTAASGGESGATHRLALMFLITEHPKIYLVSLHLALPHETLLFLRQITTGFITEEEMQCGSIHRLVMLRVPESSCKTHGETSALRDAQRVLQEIFIQRILHHGHTSLSAALNCTPRFLASAFALLRATVSSSSRS